MIRSPLVLGPVVQRPEIARLADLQRKPDTIAWLAKQVKVSPVGESELFKIIYSSDNAETAAAITNAVTESYFKLRDSSEAERTQKVVDLLEKEKINRQKEVIRMRQDLSDMTKQLTGDETFTTKAEGNTQQKNRLADLQRQLLAAQVETWCWRRGSRRPSGNCRTRASSPAANPRPLEPQRSGSSRTR